MESFEYGKKPSTKKKSLGRGLNTLLGPAEPTEKPKVESSTENSGVTELKLLDILPMKDQPRKVIDEAKIEELSASIGQYGVIQPIIVSPKGEEKYEIIAGERRWRAAKLAKLAKIPAIIRNETEDKYEVALIENIQREQLNVIEEAEAYQKLINDFNMTQESIAKKIGKKRSSIANYLRLLKLPLDIQSHIKNEKISFGHAKILTTVQDNKLRKELVSKIIDESLSVRGLEEELKDEKQVKVSLPKKQKNEFSDEERKRVIVVKELENELNKKIPHKLKINYKSGAGHVGIHYKDDKELTKIIEILRKSWN